MKTTPRDLRAVPAHYLLLLCLCACPAPGMTSATEDSATTTGESAGETDATTTDATAGPTTADTEGTTTADTEGTTTGDDAIPEVPEAYGTWLKREPPGAVCSNGSQFKFFINFSETSNNLMIYLEPGGACWDYETCSGNAPLGAANPDGIPDSHMDKYGALSPILRRDVVNNPAKDWNLVFIPYCTGDVHTGNKVMTYDDPEGIEDPLVYRHNGHNNVMGVIDYLRVQFPEVGKMMLTGCSAGGAGSIINYYFFRERMKGVDRAYLLNDSGPIFPSHGNSGPLHTKIRESWDVDPILDSLPDGVALTDDFGDLNVMLASLFPNDRLSTVYFKRDYNYSRYSYERFYPDPTKEKILKYWAEDTELLTEQYDEQDNLAYFIPYWRGLNDSHCAGIVTYEGTEIQELDMDLTLFIDELLDDDAPLQSYEESDQPGEDL